MLFVFEYSRKQRREDMSLYLYIPLQEVACTSKTLIHTTPSIAERQQTSESLITARYHVHGRTLFELGHRNTATHSPRAQSYRYDNS